VKTSIRNFFGISALLAASMPMPMPMPMGGVREIPTAKPYVPTKFQQNPRKGRKNPFRGLAVPRDPGMVSYESNY
jgi:hypothetical protein